MRMLYHMIDNQVDFGLNNLICTSIGINDMEVFGNRICNFMVIGITLSWYLYLFLSMFVSVCGTMNYSHKSDIVINIMAVATLKLTHIRFGI